MKTLDMDEIKIPAYCVRNDVKEQNEKYWNTHSVENQRLSYKLSQALSAAYFRSKVYVNAREKFIAVKVSKPQKADILQQPNEIALCEKIVKDNGIEVLQTKTSLLFRIHKAEENTVKTVV